MSEQIDSAKVQHLLHHWIEHNESHDKSFRDWALKLKDAGFEAVSEKILLAAAKMEECNELLEQAGDELNS
jgi:hypothetical protein